MPTMRIETSFCTNTSGNIQTGTLYCVRMHVFIASAFETHFLDFFVFAVQVLVAGVLHKVKPAVLLFHTTHSICHA